MKIPVSWLRELCPTDLSAEDLAELLTHKGAEVEAIERPGAGLAGVIVARVVEVRDHPNSDNLCVARVQTGSGEQEVVVGVRNMGPGDLVPLAPPGSRIPLLAEPLGAREIRGVVSNGMLCAPDELGISPSHEGILVLPSGPEPGTDVATLYGLGDAVLDIEVTPNRPDFLSVLGIAREVSAATGTPLVPPDVGVDEADEPADGVATLEVHDLERCPRYVARLLRGVRHTSSPIPVQARLTAAGMRPISAAVDATNYAMLEIGQPLHPFDLPLLKGPGIVVRRALDGEAMMTLDDLERTFTTDDLLICDLERPVGVAGVMGGELAEISEITTDVLLEAASFQREGIQRTRRRLGLSTEASMRFERGVDPEAAPVGADRACRLMTEWCGARVLRGRIEVGGAPDRRRIRMRTSRAAAVIGYPVSVSEAADVFDRLGLAHEAEDGDTIRVEIPGYRVDLEREVDLIEEVVRVQGYERVGSTLPAIRQPGGVPDRYAFAGRVRRAMVGAGLREIRQVPFVSDRDLALAGGAPAVRVSNPLQADEGWLRTGLLPGVLAAVKRNSYRHVRSIALFEAGTVFGLVDGAARESLAAAFAVSGLAEAGWAQPQRGVDVFDAKGVVQAVLSELGIDWSTGPPPGPPFHPGRSASILADGERLGAFGEVHPKVAAAFDLGGRVAAGELDVEALQRRSSSITVVREPPRFPPVRRDLAFTVDAATPAGAVRDALVEAGGDLVDACLLFDVHVGPPLPADTKSLAFSVDFRAGDRTLTDGEVTEAVNALADRLERDLGATLRSSERGGSARR
ncbi:MAG TPA: phenylalanine--tRNA ligase subunit beta [Actinomycetota bacterium]